MKRPQTSPKPAVQACRECGCTDARACPGGCFWIFPDLCSTCFMLRLQAVIPGLQKAAQEQLLENLTVLSEQLIARLDAVDPLPPDLDEEPMPRLWRPGDAIEPIAGLGAL